LIEGPYIFVKQQLREIYFSLLPSYWSRLTLPFDRDRILAIGRMVGTRLNLIAMKAKYRPYGALYYVYRNNCRLQVKKAIEQGGPSKEMLLAILSGSWKGFKELRPADR